MRALISALLVGACLSVCGCATSLHVNRGATAIVFDGGSEAVFVTNPELVEEFAILRESGIYLLTERPEGARRLTLHPVRQYGRCGNPLLLSAFTLGLIPGYLPGAITFEYELESSVGVESFSHHLPVYERFSIWEHFGRRDRTDVLSEALKHSERIKRQPNQALQTTSVTRSGLATILDTTQRKEAEPGATDNPDDTQRLREDH